MSYATQQNLIDRFGEAELKEVADRDGDTVLDAAVIAGVLADADDLIDSYIGKRYALPLATTPTRLVRLAADIARYYLYEDSPTEVVKTAYRDALAFLRDVSEGKAVLDVAGAEPETASDAAQTDGPDRTFSRETLGGF